MKMVKYGAGGFAIIFMAEYGSSWVLSRNVDFYVPSVLLRELWSTYI